MGKKWLHSNYEEEACHLLFNLICNVYTILSNSINDVLEAFTFKVPSKLKIMKSWKNNILYAWLFKNLIDSTPLLIKRKYIRDVP